jgi:16S rRNA (guanine966-N2)-methyltransferase
LVRISGGDKKKSSLKVAKGVRPTRAAVRRSIFDRLGPWIEGKRVLELFAGTGVVGFEALLRGASEVWFIEKSNRVFTLLKANAEKLGLSKRVHMLKMDVKKGIDILIGRGETFDLIFADPPYAFEGLEKTLKGIHNLLREDGFLILEVRKDREPPEFSNLFLEKEGRFGDTKIIWYCSLSR